MSIQWKGVMPATLTQFNADLTIDHGIMAEHGKWLIDNGCTAVIWRRRDTFLRGKARAAKNLRRRTP
jgi:hypothetical protein